MCTFRRWLNIGWRSHTRCSEGTFVESIGKMEAFELFYKGVTCGEAPNFVVFVGYDDPREGDASVQRVNRNSER